MTALWHAVADAAREQIDPRIEYSDLARDGRVFIALGQGGDPNDTPPAQHSCLYLAMENPELTRVAHTLLQYGARWSLPADADALAWVARAHPSVQLRLFARGAPLVLALGGRLPEGQTLLHAVVRRSDTYHQPELVRKLLQAGAADPSLPDAHGKRAYEYARTREVHAMLLRHVLGDARRGLWMLLRRRLGEPALVHRVLSDLRFKDEGTT